MGLLTTYGPSNRVVEEDLAVTYSKVQVSGNWAWESISVSGSYSYMWELHRYATKRFKYVGMDLTTANNCRTDLVTALTRSFRVSLWNGSVNQGQWNRTSGGTILPSDIKVIKTAGLMYEVQVNVNEDDVFMAKISENPDPSTSFTLENQRSYDITSGT